MINFYRLKENKFYIEAPGRTSQNRIKNDLVWDINRYLNQEYCLYEFFPFKEPPNSFNRISCLNFIFDAKWKCGLEPLNDMFIYPRELSKKEVENFRQVLDPKRRMQNDVFYESLCMENVDLDYIAIKKNSMNDYAKPLFKTKNSLYLWVESFAPIRVSLFGAKEVQICINEMELYDPIKEIILKHCELNPR